MQQIFDYKCMAGLLHIPWPRACIARFVGTGNTPGIAMTVRVAEGKFRRTRFDARNGIIHGSAVVAEVSVALTFILCVATGLVHHLPLCQIRKRI